MKKILILSCAILLSVSCSAAEENEPSANADSVNYKIKEEARPKMIKSDMVKEIKGEILDSDERLLEIIEGLKKQKDESGKEFYTYHTDAGDVRLEDLDDNTLEQLLFKVYKENATIQIKENMDIMENVRQAQRLPEAPPTYPKNPTTAPKNPTTAPEKPAIIPKKPNR